MRPRALASRVLTALAATAALSAALVTPAAASPEDGQGCVGTPTIPLTYVCVVSLTPTNAVPDVAVTTYVPVDVPPICYFLDCTEPTTVNVPVPTVTPGSGWVAVLYHDGTYYPIAVSTEGVQTVLAEVVELVRDLGSQSLCATVNDVLYRFGAAMNCSFLTDLFEPPVP